MELSLRLTTSLYFLGGMDESAELLLRPGAPAVADVQDPALAS